MAGDRSHQKLFMLMGAPRGGKGTFAKLCEMLVGAGNFQGIDDHALGYMFGLQEAIGKMLVTITEAGDLAQKQVSRLKAATGNDDFTVPMKHSSAFTGKISCNWLMQTNNVIALPDSSAAIMTRLKILRFNHSFLGSEDSELPRKLRAELPAIAAWARVGYLRFIGQGRLSDNPHADSLMDILRESSSTMSSFVRECCIVAESLNVSKSDFFEKYSKWLAENDHDPVTRRNVKLELISVAPTVNESRTSKERQWIGIRLK